MGIFWFEKRERKGGEVRCFLESGIKKQEKGMFEMFLWRMDDVLYHDIIYSDCLLECECANVHCVHYIHCRVVNDNSLSFFFFL